MGYVQQQMTSSTTYLFARLQKTFISCEPKERMTTCRPIYIIMESKWKFFI